MSRTTTGSAFGLGTALIWGAMFVIAKSALGKVDPFHLTAIRYLVASLVLLAVLWAVEGWRPFASTVAASISPRSAPSASPASTCSPSQASHTRPRRAPR